MKNSVDINDVLSQRLQPPHPGSLEQTIIAYSHQAQHQLNLPISSTPRVYIHKLTPMFASALLLALGLALYIPSGLKNFMSPAISFENETQDQVIDIDSAVLAELELQEIWMLHDELFLL